MNVILYSVGICFDFTTYFLFQFPYFFYRKTEFHSCVGVYLQSMKLQYRKHKNCANIFYYIIYAEKIGHVLNLH